MKIFTEALRLWDIFDYKLDGHSFFGFEIPEIQRDYSWDIGIKNDANQADDAYRLIRDLLDFHDRDRKAEDNYFLGTLILFSMKSGYSKEENRLQIMDGQQRMTSLIALFSVIRYIILKSKCKNLRIIMKMVRKRVIVNISQKKLEYSFLNLMENYLFFQNRKLQKKPSMS